MMRGTPVMVLFPFVAQAHATDQPAGGDSDNHLSKMLDRVVNRTPPDLNYTKQRGGTKRKESDDCCICMERPVSHTLLPCGHASFCKRCAGLLAWKHAPCPLCREKISHTEPPSPPSGSMAAQIATRASFVDLEANKATSSAMRGLAEVEVETKAAETETAKMAAGKMDAQKSAQVAQQAATDAVNVLEKVATRSQLAQIMAGRRDEMRRDADLLLTILQAAKTEAAVELSASRAANAAETAQSAVQVNTKVMTKLGARARAAASLAKAAAHNTELGLRSPSCSPEQGKLISQAKKAAETAERAWAAAEAKMRAAADLMPTSVLLR
eukprot:gnl/TRDRNA2_/TRDRNA2_173147_c0_seq2.p1 gnl/TRDRNA2_/TRDRNA2_173147_c0~~gnl/TRDRNA2_/TRDRNA2_173147_c0_seq2.p1  ORF type:complete len:326 (-),score=73.38 gnl/TRDRNA2_/TRDRNA2_173147_c0_seq2:159-1136(-)